MTTEEYNRLKEEVAAAKSEAERAQGALAQLTSRLEEEFKCTDLKSAKAKLRELEEQAEEAEAALEEAVTAYQKKWKGE